MLAKITVADYMTKRMVTLKEETDVVEAIQMMLDHKITCAPVVNNQGDLVGMFSEGDSMKVVLETAYNQSMVGRVGEFMTREIQSVDANSSILDLAEQFLQAMDHHYVPATPKQGEDQDSLECRWIRQG